ncbi:luciferase domain-containing protein [Streptacidiphilus melanogenes]|uniref:luciferase domain-containing protein n=1 Tax=Streptacidiphilus melanogenes TaxID=411235 RepID=UPI000693509D
MTVADRAMEQLASWSSLAHRPSDCVTGEALWAGTREIAHLHGDRRVALCLTTDTVIRLRDELELCSAVRLRPDSPWVTVVVECDTDADLLMTLVSAALQAHSAQRPMPETAPCDIDQSTIIHLQDTPTQRPGATPGRTHARRIARRRNHSRRHPAA